MTATYSRWWRGDHHGWLSGYLAARGISGATRVLMASISASLVLCLIALLTSSDGPHGTIPVAMTWAAAAGGTAGETHHRRATAESETILRFRR